MGFRDGQYQSAEAVTPSDTTRIAFDGLYIGGAGAVAIKTDDNATAVTLAAVPVGTILRIRGIQVMLTNTTATNIVALKE